MYDGDGGGENRRRGVIWGSQYLTGRLWLKSAESAHA